MNLNAENYYSREANLEYMSVSQFKAFDACPAAAMAELRGEYQRPTSTALLVGSYVDAFFEGTLEDFKARNAAAILKRDGNLKADYVQAETMIDRAYKDALFMEYMSGEKQVIMTGEIMGVKVKIKIDSYHAGKMIVDLKTVRDFDRVSTPNGRKHFIDAWGYDLQGAVYQEIVRQNTGDKLPFYIAAITKETVPDLDVIQISQAVLDRAYEHFTKFVTYYDGVKRGVFEEDHCGVCNYCKSTKKLTEPTLYDVEIDLVDFLGG